MVNFKLLRYNQPTEKQKRQLYRYGLLTIKEIEKRNIYAKSEELFRTQKPSKSPLYGNQTIQRDKYFQQAEILLLECSKENGTCEYCTKLNECEDLWNWLSNVAIIPKNGYILTKKDYNTFIDKFKNLRGKGYVPATQTT